MQTLTIEGWLPAPLANGQHGHWFTRQRKLNQAKEWARNYALNACWRRVDGPARLDIVLVFPAHRRRDTDNLYARCKGLVDGLKGRYFVDDSTDWLDLHVAARVEKGRKAVELTLAPATGTGGRAGD